jgi:hypothetical protein
MLHCTRDGRAVLQRACYTQMNARCGTLAQKEVLTLPRK